MSPTTRHHYILLIDIGNTFLKWGLFRPSASGSAREHRVESGHALLEEIMTLPGQLSKLPTLSVFLTTKLVYRPANIIAKPVAKKLFYNDYMNHLGTFGWREQHNIVFDHLVAPTAFYISKEEFEEWWHDVKAEDVEITWHNQNSWCGFGRV